MSQLKLSKLGSVLAIGVVLTLGLGVSAEACIGGIQCVKDVVEHPAPSYASCIAITGGVLEVPEGGNTVAVEPRNWRVFSSKKGDNMCSIGIFNKGAAEIYYTPSALLEVGKDITEACFAPAKAEAAAAGGWTAGVCKTDGFDIWISDKDSFRITS